jgi:Flp pilus assembly protein TadB
MTSSTIMFANPLGHFLLCFAILLALLGLFEAVQYLGSYSPLTIIALSLLILCARWLGWLKPSLSMPARRPPFEDESRRSREEPEGLASPIEPLMSARNENLSSQGLAPQQVELRRDLVADFAEIERRKASWQWAVARWSVDLPTMLKIGYQLAVFVSLGFFIGTGIVASLTGLNLLLSFFIAEVVAVTSFYGFQRMRRKSRNRR